jgi:hypothetical protein
MPAETVEAASFVERIPVTSQGCRPISVVYQPASVATQPENIIGTSITAKGRGIDPRLAMAWNPYQGCAAGFPVHWCKHDGAHTLPDFAPDATAAFFSSF